MAHLEAYLARSKAYLIDFELRIATGMSQRPRDKVEEYLGIAARSSERWRSFKVCFSDSAVTSLEEKEVMHRLVEVLQNASVPNLQVMDLSSHLNSPMTVAPRIFLNRAPRLSTLKLSSSNWLHPLPPLDSITTLTISRGAPIPIIPFLSLPSPRHFSIVYEDDLEPFNDPILLNLEAGQFEARQRLQPSPSTLTSLRLPVYNLPSLYDLPGPLRQVFSKVTHLCLYVPDVDEGSDVDSEVDLDDDDWKGWPSNLAEELKDPAIDLFPSLEHLTIVAEKPNVFKKDPALCRLTHRISTLTVLEGGLILEEDSDMKTVWPRLRSVYFEELAEDIVELTTLVSWLTQRGRLPGSLEVTLGPEAKEALLDRMEIILQQELREMKAVVDLAQSASQRRLEDLWPPKDE